MKYLTVVCPKLYFHEGMPTHEHINTPEIKETLASPVVLTTG
jgi:hypothetical protein